MPQFIYTMKGLGKVHPPDHVVLKDIWLSFLPGAKIGVLGLNGAGKSTLLRIMAGRGQAVHRRGLAGRGHSVGFLQQEPKLDPSKTVLGNVEEGVADVKALLTRYDEINAKFGEDLTPEEMEKILEEQGKVQDASRRRTAGISTRASSSRWTRCGCRRADADVTKLSGGERRRVALCRLLLQAPDLLLLDEPTNHLDAESVAWLERFLQEYPGTVVAVTHDRYFLDNVAGWILELDRGAGIPWEGNYSSWLEQKQKRLAIEEKSETQAAADARARARVDPHVAARAAGEGQGAPERVRRAAARRRRRRRSIRSRSTFRPARGSATSSSRRAGVRKAYGDMLLMEDVNFTLPRGGIVGVIGPNGAGKTTLFRMITGQEKPDAGTLRLGETVQIGYVDQSRDALAADKSVWEEITGGARRRSSSGSARSPRAPTCPGSTSRGAISSARSATLSGGERNRVHLAKLLKGGANLLLLDEPTNDLDVDTLRALEEALLSFAGCAVVISHDRWFLDRIATHMLAFEGDSKVVWFEGNYQDYEADRHRRLGAEADQPHRIKYRKLTR